VPGAAVLMTAAGGARPKASSTWAWAWAWSLTWTATCDGRLSLAVAVNDPSDYQGRRRTRRQSLWC